MNRIDRIRREAPIVADERKASNKVRTAIRERFLVDGCTRARSEAEPVIRAQMVAEYAERVEAADAWGRFWLRREMEREIRARVEKLAPRDALY
jgi:hypothetical protein